MRNGLFVEAAGFYDSAVGNHPGQIGTFHFDTLRFVPSNVGEVAVQIFLGTSGFWPSSIFGDNDDFISLYVYHFHQAVGHAVLFEAFFGEGADFGGIEVAHFGVGQNRVEPGGVGLRDASGGRLGRSGGGCGRGVAVSGCQYGNEGKGE